MQAERGIAGVLATSQSGHRIDLLVGVTALPDEALDGFHGARLDPGIPVQLEGAAHDVQDVLLGEAFTGQQLGETGDRRDLGGHEVRVLAGRDWSHVRGALSWRGRGR